MGMEPQHFRARSARYGRHQSADPGQVLIVASPANARPGLLALAKQPFGGLIGGGYLPSRCARASGLPGSNPRSTRSPRPAASTQACGSGAALSSMCLSKAELTELCRSPRKAKQIEFLLRNGIHHYLDEYGWPVVLRASLASGAPAVDRLPKKWEPALRH